MRAILYDVFGTEWAALSHADRNTVLADFAELCRDEYDIGDPTVADCVERENMEDAAREYRRRIGRGNLAAYVRSLLAAHR